jgi:hypothetical protein
MDTATWLRMMAVGYVLTVAIEATVLVMFLSRRHPLRHRVFAGLWLTACTYPVVWLVLPSLLPERWLYLLVAETFAPAAECMLFWLAFGRAEPRSRAATIRDIVIIIVANLLSFGLGEGFNQLVGWAWLTGGKA